MHIHTKQRLLGYALLLVAGVGGLSSCTRPPWGPSGSLSRAGFARDSVTLAATSSPDRSRAAAIPTSPEAAAAVPPMIAQDRRESPWPLAAPVSPRTGNVAVAWDAPAPRADSEPAPSVRKAAAKSAGDLPRGKVTPVDMLSFNRHVLEADEPVLVDFYADWCGPCRALAPTLEQLAAENPHARVVKVNIDHSPELAARYGVQSVPRLLVFKDGRVAAQQSGVVSKTKLASMLALQ